ncbi:MAG: V4R domain-containing protein [Planctomycetota bacterium]
MFKEERTESRFAWDMLGNLDAGRPNLGPSMPVAVYRLMQFTLRDVLIREVGVEKADRIFYDAGRRAGEEYFAHVMQPQADFEGFFAELQRTLKDQGIGIFRVESMDEGRRSFVVTIAEDLDCSGIPVCSEQICTYDEGFLAAVFEAQTGATFRAKEIDCWGTGDRVCRFTVDA